MNTPSAGQRGYVLFLASFLSILLLGGSATTGYLIGKNQAPQAAQLDASSKEVAKNTDLSTFWESWSILDKKFYGELSTEKRVNGAIGGMVGGLGDPYTTYLAPKENKLFRSSIEGKFGGIGAELEIRNQLLTIVAPLQGTPAERAGLRSGDVIVKIDDKQVSELSFVDAIDLIRGEVGTKVVLTIARSGQESTFELTIERATITIESAKQDEAWQNQSIGYLRVNQFGEDTSTIFINFLKSSLDSGKKGVIIDMRNNPGGLVNKAVDMVGALIPNSVQSEDKNVASRVVLREIFKDQPEEVYRAVNAAVAPDLPVVVLINEGSASASEIFAGALRDYKRATLVGVKSFGKGSVQDLVPLKNGGSIKVTIANWLTPLGTEINGKGIEPDYVVELGPEEKLSISDAQVTKALELLETGLNQ